MTKKPYALHFQKCSPSGSSAYNKCQMCPSPLEMSPVCWEKMACGNMMHPHSSPSMMPSILGWLDY